MSTFLFYWKVPFACSFRFLLQTVNPSDFYFLCQLVVWPVKCHKTVKNVWLKNSLSAFICVQIAGFIWPAKLHVWRCNYPIFSVTETVNFILKWWKNVFLSHSLVIWLMIDHWSVLESLISVTFLSIMLMLFDSWMNPDGAFWQHYVVYGEDHSPLTEWLIVLLIPLLSHDWLVLDAIVECVTEADVGRGTVHW